MENILQRKYLDKVRTIAIYGNTGTGKTSLAFNILQLYKDDKKIYLIKHPKPELLEEFGYKNLRSLEELERLQDCVIYWDEPQLTTSIYDKKSNSIIAKVCSLARQRNITIIISSSDTRVFTKSNEAYFDLWLILDVDYTMVKQGSKIRKAIKDNAILEPEGFRLEVGEFISESRKLMELNGKHTYNLPKNWSEELSKPYYNAKKSAKENAKK